MKSTFITGCIGAVLSCLALAPAWADVSDIRASDRSVEVDFGATGMSYGETINHTSFDTERGYIPTVAADIQWLVKADSPVANDTYLALDSQFSFGSNTYTGGYQPCTMNCAFDSTDSNDVFEVDGKVGHFFQMGSWASLTPYLDMGFRYWRRNVDSEGFLTNYVERYESGDLMAGMMLQMSPVQDLVLTMSAAGGSTIDPRMSTSGSGAFNLGSDATYQFMGKIGYTFAPQVELVGTARYVGLGFGASQLVGGGSYEPNSYSHELTFLGGLSYHLQ
jgi:hypothetical protein